MRSIIDEIAQAEAQAEQIRQDAAVSARELLQKARVDAEQGLQSLNDEEREKTRLALEQAEREGHGLADAIQKQLSDEADALCGEARGRLGDAVNYLMRKVQEIA